jgi:hypothetical protein
MAGNSLSRIPITFEMRVRHAIHWQMHRAAREIVIKRLKAEGAKTTLMARSQITRLGLEYLRENQAELLAQAEASGAVQRLRVEADFAKIKSDAQAEGH